jgi:hypothetical protein
MKAAPVSSSVFNQTVSRHIRTSRGRWDHCRLDRGGPQSYLVISHAASRLETRVRVTPGMYVDEILSSRQQGAAAHAIAVSRHDAARPQVVEQPVRHDVASIGIGEQEQQQVRKKHVAVIGKSSAQPVPIEVASRAADDVEHVCAIEALALHDERFRPDHLLRRADVHWEPEDNARSAVTDPLGVDSYEAVAAGENEVDEIGTARRLGEPMREFEVSLDAGRRQDVPDERPIVFEDEEIEIFRLPGDARETFHRVRPAHDERHTGVVEARQDRAVKLDRGPVVFVRPKYLHEA